MDKIERCLDTYALVEIALNNPKFKEYTNMPFVIADTTLAEFYSVLLREEGESVADYWYKKLERYSLTVDKEILIMAIKFRNKHKKQNISFFDAVGYIFALKKGYLFVTGDKEFENLPNIEFKKK
jgi:predicted nucleic acid-binding protein